jgi:NodT family efflux transporter outer membrane factor (OMF) lipoprotein
MTATPPMAISGSTRIHGLKCRACIVLAAFSAIPLAGCTVGPDFNGIPSSQSNTDIASVPVQHTVGIDVAGGEVQAFSEAQDLAGQWWALFGSDALDGLVEQAMKTYPDIVNQQAALKQARENWLAERGSLFPQIQGTGEGARSKTASGIVGGAPSFITNVFQASVNVSYTVDLFGGQKRAVEGLRAQMDAQQWRLRASYLTLTSNVAAAYVQLAEIRELIAATHEIIELEGTQLRVIDRRVQIGSQTRADLLQQQASLASVRATLPPLQQQLDATEHEIVVLVGCSENEAEAIDASLSQLKLPRDLPVSLPSELLARRPDIGAEEANVHVASAAIGVATANMLPQLSISGSYGGEALQIAKLLSPGANIWSAAASVTQPLFEGGALSARRRAAIDGYDSAVAQYRLTVRQAFQGVSDVLSALDNDAQSLSAQFEALSAAQSSLDLIQRQYDMGAANFVALLTAQQSYQEARVAYVRAQASRFTDTVTLFQALGGGWWNRHDPAPLSSNR